MKKLIFITVLMLGFGSFGQKSGQVVIDWSPNSKISYGIFDVNVPSFTNAGFDFNLSKKTIRFNLDLQNSGSVIENSLKITNIVTENISVKALGELDLNAIPNTISAKITNSQDRDEINGVISIAPIIKQENLFYKIVSFDYNYTNGQLNRSPQTTNGISNSVLSTGSWFRFYIQKSGVYALNKSFLESLGMKVSDFDPRNFKIYGSGGRMLPLKNSTFYPIDLTENAIQVIGENDGVFNDGDYALFYGEAADSWDNDNETFGNLYDEKAYYYINTGIGAGKRIPLMTQPSGSTGIINTFDDESYFEKDVNNIGKLGRQWFGDNFTAKTDQSFEFNIPNIVTGSAIQTEIHLAAKANNITTFKIKANGNDLGGLITIPKTPDGAVFKDTIVYNSIPATDNVKIEINYNNNGVPISEGFLDYIRLKTKRNLVGYGKQFIFRNNNFGVGTFQISNATNISQVWDISDLYNVSKIVNPNQTQFSFDASLGVNQKYLAIDNADFYSPSKDKTTTIGNQNLKGTIFNDAQGNVQNIDYLIVTPSFLYNEAEKLAVFHRNYSSLNVKVVTLESIYPEFSSGKQDIAAIRNFVKYVYKNQPTSGYKLKYLNLFGDASYDFKNPNNRTRNNTNIVPIYHSIESNSLAESSFASDDFFGMMDSNEGILESTYGKPDVAVGRMIVSSTQQAAQMINKVIEYHDLKSYGNWRNNYVIIADDPNRELSGDRTLQDNQNTLADKISLEKPFVNVKKILLDSYVQTTTSGGYRYPKAKEDIFNEFEKGALVFNYLGHGGEDGLAQESIWEKADGINLKNQFKYPLFITMTCDFSRFDNPTRQTAGEMTYWNPAGGAIAMITTVREIYQSNAELFNTSFGKVLFSYGSNNYVSIGEALRLTKNINASAGKVIFCIGDPALMLAIPRPKIMLTKINDMPITGPVDDLKSLAYVKLSGEVLDEIGLPLTNYNGDLAVNIFDKFIPRKTLTNDFDLDSSGNIIPPIDFITLGETIFRGNASVKSGKFEFGFVVPRDIRIPVATGRISFYAKRNEIRVDKTGFDNSIKIGGVNTLSVADTTPPTVRLFINDTSFVNGGITNQSPIFLAFIDDENGINTASGIGHDIVAILDGKITIPYILNDYFETELDNYKKGKVKFKFKNLAVGLHTITFKAWDVYNNLVTAEIQFMVVGDETLTLTNVLNYPNPFVNYTQFWFTHNRPFEPLEVQVQVLTLTGKLVWTKNETINTTGFLSREITWDGKDDFGDRIGKGVYVYKLTVKSTLTSDVTEKYEKLVIL